MVRNFFKRNRRVLALLVASALVLNSLQLSAAEAPQNDGLAETSADAGIGDEVKAELDKASVSGGDGDFAEIFSGLTGEQNPKEDEEGNYDYYAGPVTVSLSEDLSTDYRFEYYCRADDKTYLAVENNSCTIEESGTYCFYVRNKEASGYFYVSMEIKIDGAAPEIVGDSLEMTGIYSGSGVNMVIGEDVKLVFQVKDTESKPIVWYSLGSSQSKQQVDDGNIMSLDAQSGIYEVSVTIPAEQIVGEETVTFEVTDQAGNKGSDGKYVSLTETLKRMDNYAEILNVKVGRKAADGSISWESAENLVGKWLNAEDLEEGLKLSVETVSKGTVSELLYQNAAGGQQGVWKSLTITPDMKKADGADGVSAIYEVTIPEGEASDVFLTDAEGFVLKLKASNGTENNEEAWMKTLTLPIDMTAPDPAKSHIRITSDVDGRTVFEGGQGGSVFARESAEVSLLVYDALSKVAEVELTYQIEGQSEAVPMVFAGQAVDEEIEEGGERITYQVFRSSISQNGDLDEFTVKNISMIKITDWAGNSVLISPESQNLLSGGPFLYLDNVAPVLTDVEAGNESLMGDGSARYYQSGPEVTISLKETFYDLVPGNQPTVVLYRKTDSDGQPVDVTNEVSVAVTSAQGGAKTTFRVPDDQGVYYFTYSYTDNSGNQPIVYQSPELVVTEPRIAAQSVTDPVQSTENGDNKYYSSDITVAFSISEPYSFRNFRDDDEAETFFIDKGNLNFEIARSDSLSVLKTNPEWKSVKELVADGTASITVGRNGADADTIDFTVTIKADGYYRYRFSAKGNSKDAEVAYTDPAVYIRDTEAPAVSFDGYFTRNTDGTWVPIESQKQLTYESDGNRYTYFDQTDGRISEVYLKLRVEELNFRADSAADYTVKIQKSSLASAAASDVSGALSAYLAKEENWETEGIAHSVYIPIHSAALGFGEGRYDLDQFAYQDLSKNPSETAQGQPAAEAHVVYDQTSPLVEVDYSQNLIQKFASALSRVFWFCRDTVTVTIRLTEETAGLKEVRVTDGEVEEQIADNYDQHFGFQLDYQRQPEGALTNDEGNKILLTADHIKRDGASTTITFDIPAQFRGRLCLEMTDKTNLHSSYNMTDPDYGGEDAVLAVDDTVPVLNSVTYSAAPQQTVVPDTLETLEESQAFPYSQAYFYYYQDAFDVTLEMTEANFLEGLQGTEELYFNDLKDLVEIKLYRASVPDGVYEEADVNWDFERVDSDTYRFHFGIPAEGSGSIDGCYYYTVGVRDYSGNFMKADGQQESYITADLDEKTGVYTSPVLIVDSTAPVVSFGGYYYRNEEGAKTPIEAGKQLTYESEANKYTYFDQTEGGISEVYLKLQIEELNFRMDNAADYTVEMLKSFLIPDSEKDVSDELTDYLTGKENWETEGIVHSIYIPLHDAGLGFGEGRYDLNEFGYRDLSGNQDRASQDGAATQAHAVYDQTDPQVEVAYSQNLIQKVESALSNVFWFFHDQVTVTIKLTEETAGIRTVEVTDGEVEGQIADNYDQHFGFTLDYQEDAEGVLTNEDGQSIRLNVEQNVERSGAVTTIQFKVPAQFRGRLLLDVSDKNGLGNAYETFDQDLSGMGRDAVIVVDDTAPVLDSIIYGNDPQQAVAPATLETLEEEQAFPYSQEYLYYYDDDIDVTFEITEANFLEGVKNTEELYFNDLKDLVEIRVYRASSLDGVYEAVETDWDYKRLDKDSYRFHFCIPAGENGSGDGHYYYTIQARDYSGNLMVPGIQEYYKADDLDENGIYTSPVLTLDTTPAKVEIQFLNEAGEEMKYSASEHEYYNGGAVTIGFRVTEHNFRPSDLKLLISAVDVNGKADRVASVIDANKWIEKTLEELADNVNSVWTPEGQDVYTKKITIHSPGLDANYMLDVSYQDMADLKADDYDYNGTSMGAVPLSGDEFTVDSVEPVLVAIDNTDESDIRYYEANSSWWVKFLNYITFGYFSQNSLEVIIIAHDEISGVDWIGYDAYLTENDAVSMTRNVDSGTFAAADLTEGDHSARYITFRLSPDFKGDVTARAVDLAKNQCADQSLKGIVLESGAQHESDGSHVNIDIMTPPSREVGGEAFYNSNVGVEFTFADSYSGLGGVVYSLAESGIYTKSYEEEEDVVYSDVVYGTVEAGANNANDVILTASYVDNVGHGAAVERSINIDVTEPVITVEYNTYDAQNEDYYKEPRIAYVTIQERNFQESDVEFTITNTDGVMPQISGWSHSGGNGVSDTVTHTCSVVFDADGDYTFTLECIDMAGNASHYGIVDEFTVDLTEPEITVDYDNNSFENDYYYNDYRRATIHILEHNFNAGDVSVNITAQNDGESTGVPSVSGWSTSGDLHTASIYYDKDAEYTFDISYSDLAGNEAVPHGQEHFVIDTVAPELEITGVENFSANNGTVMPRIIYSDVNLEDYSITLSGYKKGPVNTPEVSVTTQIHNGAEIALNDLERIRDNDDLYTLHVLIRDLAGNESEDEIVYSVNRFGSVFVLEEATERYVEEYYHKEEMDLVVREINVDTITSTEITYSVNGGVTTLDPSDYDVVAAGGKESWKEKVYTLHKDNFQTEGEYSVSIISNDEAQNAMSNKTYAADEGADTLIEFVIDKTKPYTIITGVEDGKQYNDDSRSVTIDARDNIYLDRLDIMLDDVVIASYDTEQLDESGGLVTLELDSSNRRQKLEAVAVDKAGNESEENVVTFLLTKNLFYQYINNRAAVVGTVAAAAVAVVVGVVTAAAKSSLAAGAAGSAAAGGILAALFRKKKKDEDKDQDS